MRKILLATAMLVAMVATASADQTLRFACVNPEVDNPEGDVIGVILTLKTSVKDPYTKVSNFVVGHKVDGKLYVRGDQYHDIAAIHEDGKIDFRWFGTLNKNTNVVMGGRLWWNPDYGWYYTEIKMEGKGPVETATPETPCKLLDE